MPCLIRGSRRHARARLQVAHELLCGPLPRKFARILPAGFAVEPQSTVDCNAQVLVQAAAGPWPHHIEWTRYRKRGDRRAASHGFEQDDAKGIRAARKHEYVGRRKVLSQLLPVLVTRKDHVRMTCLQRFECRPPSNHVFGARHLELEEGLEILLHGDPAGVQKDWSW